MAVINTNVKALFSQMALTNSGRSQSLAMQQLSTGKRINSARDDAAGMAIATRMTHQIRSLNQAVRNAGDAINLIQTAEGATNEITDMMQRMRELAVQAVNDTNDNAQRSYLDLEFQQLKQQIVQIADNTEWNGFPVLNGSAGERVGEMPVYKTTSTSTTKPGDVFIAEPALPSVAGNQPGQKQTLTFTGTPAVGQYSIDVVDKNQNTKTIAVTIGVGDINPDWSGVIGKIQQALQSTVADLTTSVTAATVPQVDTVSFSPALATGDTVVIGGVSVTLTAEDPPSPANYANQVKAALVQDPAFNVASGRSIGVDPDTGALTITYASTEGAVAAVNGDTGTWATPQAYGAQVAINFKATQGDLSAVTVTPSGGAVAPDVLISHVALDTQATTASWDPVGGQFLKSGALSVKVLPSGEVQAIFTPSRSDGVDKDITLTGTLHPSLGTITFDKSTNRNGEVLSANLTYAFKDLSNAPLSEWLNRDLSMNVKVEGKIPAMQDGDLYINGVNIGASTAQDDLLSPADNAAGSAIAKAAAINRMAMPTGITTGEQQTLTLTGQPVPNSTVTVGGVTVQLSANALTAPLAAAEIANALKSDSRFADTTGRTISYLPGSSVITINYAKDEGDVASLPFDSKNSGLKGLVDTTVEHYTAIPGTGVFAKVNQNIMTGAAMNANSVMQGAVFINGYASADIATVLNNTRESRANVVRAINLISDKTGVKAIDTGSDAKGISLVAADGRNIEVRFETKDNVADFASRTGLTQGVQAGTYSLESKIDAPVVIGTTGDITRTGLMEGNFTKNQSVVNTSSRPAVEPAKAQVDSVRISGTPDGTQTPAETYAVTVKGVQFTVTNDGTLDTPMKVRDALVLEINKKKDAIGVTASAGNSLGELKLTANTPGVGFVSSVQLSDNAAATMASSTSVENAPAKVKPLGMNDLVINGTAIRPSTAQDDTFSQNIASSSASSASAIAIANAINSQSATTGVRAQPNPVVSTATELDLSNPIVAGNYSLYLNGTQVSVYLDPTDSADARMQHVMKAINDRTGQHGITASNQGAGGLTLTSDGRNVSAWFDSSVPGLSAASFGLGKAGADKQVSTVAFPGANAVGDGPITLTVNDQVIAINPGASDDDAAIALAFKTKIEANPYLKNIGVSINTGVLTLTSKVAGSGFTVSGAKSDDTGVLEMNIETPTPNVVGNNDVSAIYRATETSTTAKTLYGTVRMISDPALLPIGMPAPGGAPTSDKQALLKASGRPFTISVGDDGFGANSNFSDLGFEVGTFGGQSSAAMDPPRVGRLAFQVGASNKQVITIDLADFGKNGPITGEITGDVDLNVNDQVNRINTRDGASSILTKLDSVMDKINATRATMGAVMNRLDHVINNLSNVSMNLSASRSGIEDADYAASSTELAKTQIMQQAATAVLAQANTSQQTVLKLLGG